MSASETTMPAQECFDKLVWFIRQQPDIAYARWDTPSLIHWLHYCHAQQYLHLVFAPGPNGLDITGMAIYWRMRARDWRHPHFLDAPWQFALGNELGDGMYLDQIIARPGAIPILLADGQWRNPEWRTLAFAAKRHGRLKEYGNVERFCKGLETL